MRDDQPTQDSETRNRPSAPVLPDEIAPSTDSGRGNPAGEVQPSCRICGGVDELTWFTIREMMFGSGETFPYFRCGSCGCMQIANIPDPMAPYYPPAYYSFARGPGRYGVLKKPVVRARNRFGVTGSGLLGRWVSWFFPYPAGEMAHWLARSGVSRSSAILDVGSGSGELLVDLAKAGYRNLLGVDPHIDADLSYRGVTVRRMDLGEVTGTFDLVMFHHSLEHIADQSGTIEAAADRLTPGGHCLIRIPVIPSAAWEKYGVNWVQLDAPRHYFIHSRRSLELLAGRYGLRLVEVRYDSTELQTIGSDLYRKGISLAEGNAHFNFVDRVRERRRAKRLNADARGDQAAFLFRRD